VDVLEVFELSGHGRAVVGRFLGTGGFQAVLVPAGGELTLHGLQLNYWGEPPTQGVPCEVRVARELSIGGHPARSWFPSDPLSDAKVDAGNGKMIGTHRAEGGKEQPVAAPGAEQLHLTIAPK
jgi:hypothetical protein